MKTDLSPTAKLGAGFLTRRFDPEARPAAERPRDGYLSSAGVRARYGDCSDMTLWRWLNDERVGFPAPIRIQRRRFWRLSDLEAWEAERSPSAETNSA